MRAAGSAWHNERAATRVVFESTSFRIFTQRFGWVSAPYPGDPNGAQAYDSEGRPVEYLRVAYRPDMLNAIFASYFASELTYRLDPMLPAGSG